MAQNLIKKLVIGFGFFNGFWFSLGINPQQEIIKFLQPILSEMHPWLKALFIILPTILTISTIMTVTKIYHKGGLLGAGAVVLAFLAGALLLTHWTMTIPILAVAIVLGSITIKK